MKLLKPIDINKFLQGKEENIPENKTLTDILDKIKESEKTNW